MKTTFSNPLRFLFAFCVALWAGAATGVAADQVTDQVTFLAMVPQLTIAGTFGATDQIQYCTNMSQGNWVPLTNLLVQATSYCFVDVSAPLASTIAGTFGATDQIQYCTNMSQGNWVPLTNLLVQATSYCFVDVSAPLPSSRFYRVVRLSPDGMVLIPAGSFTMGDDVDGQTSALPMHTGYVSADRKS